MKIKELVAFLSKLPNQELEVLIAGDEQIGMRPVLLKSHSYLGGIIINWRILHAQNVKESINKEMKLSKCTPLKKQRKKDLALSKLTNEEKQLLGVK